MRANKLREMIYESLMTELHKKGHKDPKGRELMKGEEDLEEANYVRDADTPGYFSPWSAEYKKDKELEEAKMTKAHAKIVSRLLIKMSVESVIPHKDVLIVNYTNYRERSKIIKAVSKLYKYDNDGRSTNAPRGIIGVGGTNWISFVSRHTESVNEGQPMFQDTPNEFAYLDFKKWAYKNRKAVAGILRKALDDNRGDGTYLFLALRQIWLAWANKKAKEFSRIPNKGPQGKDFGRALAIMMKKDNLIIKRSGNKLTDLDEGLWANINAKKKRGEKSARKGSKAYKAAKKAGDELEKTKEGIREAVYDKLLKAVPDSYSYKALAADIAKMIKDEYGSHNIKPFIKELAKLLKEGNINEATSLWKHFDMLQNMRMDSMDLEDDMRGIAKELSQTHKDMEQEAEAEGGPKATKYGKQIEKLEKEYKKKKAEFKKLMAKIDKLDQF